MSDLMNLLESKKDEIRAALGAKRDFGSWWAITQVRAWSATSSSW